MPHEDHIIDLYDLFQDVFIESELQVSVFVRYLLDKELIIDLRGSNVRE
jgi:hypothetical protein